MQGYPEILSRLYRKWSGETPFRMDQIPGSGSDRRYFRITASAGSVVGVVNDNRKENEAFLSFTGSFLEECLPVPCILSEDIPGGAYLLSDLGDVSLFQLLQAKRTKIGSFPDELMQLYLQVVEWLPRFQIRGNERIDYSKCYPRAMFDRQSMYWDLNYFKYYFLKLAHIPFNEQNLEEDFQRFSDFLLESPSDYFLYRDFQSRNIMIVENSPYFIDYQGGRKGALQYDLASLLYDAKADLPDPVRDQLFDHYVDSLSTLIPIDRSKFLAYYPGFVLIRILQALGAYGFRGYYENKPHFLQSIPFALRNLQRLQVFDRLPVKLPEIRDVLNNMTGRVSPEPVYTPGSPLHITINSFSFKRQIPADTSEHGGGFVFDCRALPNPGRFEEYRKLTGNDQPVIDFLKKEKPVELFLHHVSGLVDQSIRNYLERGFSNLSVSFGCTGGRHRSVYCAEELGKMLIEKFPVIVNIHHHNRFDP